MSNYELVDLKLTGSEKERRHRELIESIDGVAGAIESLERALFALSPVRRADHSSGSILDMLANIATEQEQAELDALK